ncbi:MAG: hypothetical protein ACQEQD_03810 [Bacillota bacterium]
MGILRTAYYNLKLNRNLKKSKEEIKNLQDKKLRKLLFYAYDNSNFYKNLYNEKGIKRKDLNDIKLENLPVVNKEIIMKNFDEIITKKNVTKKKIENFLEKQQNPTELYNNKYRIIHTSGSTGRIGIFVYGAIEWDFIKAVSLRMFSNFGLKPKRYAYIGAVDGHYAGISLFLSPINQFEEIFYEDYLIININKVLSDYLDKLNKLNPHNLTGYPSGVKMLAELQLKGKINISPETIICGGEPFLENDQKLIERAWNVKPLNYYASSESLMIGIKRPQDNNMYLMGDINCVEIQEDKTIITNLYNYTQPLIRYELSDVLKRSKNQEKDWPFKQVKKIIGRREEMIWFDNENGQREFLHPIVLAEFYVKGLKKFQIVKLDEISFLMKALINNDYDRDDVKKKIKEKMEKLLAQKNMNNIVFKIKEVEQLEADPKTGKFKLIKKDRKGED